MQKQGLEGKKINIGTIGHVDHGKKSLAATITSALCQPLNGCMVSQSDMIAEPFPVFDFEIMRCKSVALNSSDPTEDIDVGLCFELPQDGTLPAELQLTPAGIRIVGHDGRNWINDQPDKVVAAMNAIIDKRNLVVDWNHATELKAPNGDDAPASAHIKGPLEHRGNGVIVATNVEWTPGGEASLKGKEYRYHSPAFRFERTTGRLVGFSSVGLTNTPNLNLTALNSANITQQKQGDTTMDLAQLLAALGLPADAGLTVAINTINTLKTDLGTALNAAKQPDPAKFVPHADHQLALNSVKDLTTELDGLKKTGIDTAINSAVDGAISDGKVAPSSRDYHIGCCQAEGGLDRFNEQMKTAPAIIAEKDRKVGSPADEKTALNATETQIAGIFGNTPEELAATAKLSS